MSTLTFTCALCPFNAKDPAVLFDHAAQHNRQRALDLEAAIEIKHPHPIRVRVTIQGIAPIVFNRFHPDDYRNI